MEFCLGVLEKILLLDTIAVFFGELVNIDTFSLLIDFTEDKKSVFSSFTISCFLGPWGMVLEGFLLGSISFFEVIFGIGIFGSSMIYNTNLLSDLVLFVFSPDKGVFGIFIFLWLCSFMLFIMFY